MLLLPRFSLGNGSRLIHCDNTNYCEQVLNWSQDCWFDKKPLNFLIIGQLDGNWPLNCTWKAVLVLAVVDVSVKSLNNSM